MFTHQATRLGELGGEQTPLLAALTRLGELLARRGELVQFSTYIFDVLNQKSSSLSVPRHMASIVIIGNLKNSLEASIHKHRKHNKGIGNKT
jgi:hypothetical protein